MSNLEKGSSIGPVIFLVFLCIIIFVFIIPAQNGKGPTRNIYSLADERGASETRSFRNSTNSSGEAELEANSSYSRAVRLNGGNASRTIQPYEEYITISNRGESSINITGWKLANGRDKRVYELGGTLNRYPADEAYIPSGTLVIAPSGNNVMQNIVLQEDDQAVITTGSANKGGPFNITSFKENLCTGYLENMPEYDFTPSLSQSCVDPSDEPGFRALDNKCQDFIEGLRSCTVPEFGGKDREGNNCPGCINGEILPSSCAAFIKSHYNYSSCVAIHRNDPDFYSNTWRVFLGKSWEMWGANNELISLYDNLGRLVDYISY